ncbi:MAG: flagellar biosynthesis protein FlhB [Pseudomonadota bacterium]
MADDRPEEHEKTQDPSQKKLKDAREKGDVAKSQEVNSWFIMFAMTIFFMLLVQDASYDLSTFLKIFLSNIHDIPTDQGGLLSLYNLIGWHVGLAVALPFLLLMLAGIVGNLVQHGLLFTTEQIQPKLSKISPLAGLKRLFSTTSLVNFAKSLVKLFVVGGVIIAILWPRLDMLDTMMGLDPLASMGVTLDLLIRVLIGVMIIFSLLAGLDFAYQRQTWWDKQKMTLKEVRDEYKQLEGDPQVKARIRQIRQERSRRRMIASVPEASVVITNPTHFSVALKYVQGMPAPICVAKGVDDLALKIREVADAHDVPRVENPPLARALHASVDIDEEIPEEHYKAVADVIGYVMQLQREKS